MYYVVYTILKQDGHDINESSIIQMYTNSLTGTCDNIILIWLRGDNAAATAGEFANTRRATVIII